MKHVGSEAVPVENPWCGVYHYCLVAVITWTDMSPGLLEAVRTATHLENASSNTWSGGGETNSMRRGVQHTHTHTKPHTLTHNHRHTPYMQYIHD